MKLEYNISTRKKDKGHQVIVNYKDNGKWKQRTKQGFKSSREARLYGNELVDEIKEKLSLGTPEELKDITLGKFIDIYLEDKLHDIEFSTVLTYKKAFKKIESLHGMEMTKITYLHLAQCLNDAKKNLSSSTLETYFRIISTLFNAAVRPYKIIPENPLLDYKIKKTTNKESKIKIISKNSIPIFLSKLKENNQNFYIMSAIAVYTGLRLGEVLGLTWDDVDMENNKVIVNKQWNLKNNNTYGFKKTKTTNSNRTLHFPNTLKIILKKYKNNNPTHFTKRVIYKINHTSSVTSKLSKTYKKIGYDITFHDLRHTYATIMLAEGTDIKTVASLLGDSVEMVIKTYIHYSDDMREKAKEQIENIF